MDLHCMILAGGKGTRFWPVSRLKKSKQFLSILGSDSLVKQTLHRISPICPKSNRWILGNVVHAPHLSKLTNDVPHHQILQEPIGRNTAACIGWGAIQLSKTDPNAVIAFIPADQWIDDSVRFQNILRLCAQEAHENHTIVTIGIRPSSPHTGFGYIFTKESTMNVFSVSKFKEKPDYETAVQYISQDNCFWNSGIFVAKASVMKSLFQRHLPHHYQLFSQTDASILSGYDQLPSISIDYGIMEKETALIRLIPADFNWNDIGNWRAIASILKKDHNQNTSIGHYVSVDSSNNIIYSETGKLVALADVSDMIVVATQDVVLVIPQASDQKISELYHQLPNAFQ